LEKQLPDSVVGYAIGSFTLQRFRIAKSNTAIALAKYLDVQINLKE
jgi:hypothetical protein